MRYSTCKYTMTLKPELGVTQGYQKRHRSIRQLRLYDFLLTFPAMGLSQTVSEINGDFSQKLLNFPIPMYSVPLPKWFPLKLGTGVGSQKSRMTRLPGQEISLTISSAVWIQCTNMTDRGTDKHWVTANTVLRHNITR